ESLTSPRGRRRRHAPSPAPRAKCLERMRFDMTTGKVCRYKLACLGLLFLLAGSGCGKKYSLNEQVEGSIKVDGAPLVGAVVDFVPQGAEALPISTGVTDKDGQFKLRCLNKSGAVIGKHKVVIHPGRPRSPFDPEPVNGPSATPIP